MTLRVYFDGHTLLCPAIPREAQAMKPFQQLSDDEFAALAHRATRLEDAPQAWVDAAIALWPAPSTASDVLRAALRVVHAVLRFDSWAQPALAHCMRAGASDVRHLVLGTEGRDVDLRIAPSTDRPASYALSGQVLGPGDHGVLEVRSPTQPSMRTTLDDLGEFRLDGVAAGTYVLSLRFGSEELVLPAIDVGPRP